MSNLVEFLMNRFPLPELRFEKTAQELVRVHVQSEAAIGEVYLQGAHVASWIPIGHTPVLWLSKESRFVPNQPIRGGIPICFPWFGPHTDSSKPTHGYARTASWELVSAARNAEGDVSLTLQTIMEPFHVTYQVDLGQRLQVALTTRLAEVASSPIRFEDALHTYFAISDIRKIAIHGLEKSAYIDKMNAGMMTQASGQPISFEGETDRVYVDTESTCVLEDLDWDRKIQVKKSGSRSTVIWNPWIDKSRRMSDFGDDEWQGMVCIETANIAHNAITLEPGQSHTTQVVYSVL